MFVDNLLWIKHFKHIILLNSCNSLCATNCPSMPGTKSCPGHEAFSARPGKFWINQEELVPYFCRIIVSILTIRKQAERS